MSDPKVTTAAPAETLTMKQVLEQLIPSAIAAAVQASKAQAAPAARPQNYALEKCTDCGQAKIGCGGKHIQMVVYPTKYPQHADYFPGVKINGMTYLSNDESHKVVVPESAEATILGIVAAYEQNEQDMAVGRKAQRHSGVVSPNGTSFTPASQAWR